MGETAGANVSKLTILKLGGSSITMKDRPFTPNKKAIARLAEEIARSDVESLVVVHGGGSFGHPLAEHYKIDKGYRVSSQVMGFSKTHQAMKTLNKLVMDSLINHDVPAIEIQPSSCLITKSGRIQAMEQRPLIELLRKGFVPVLYGDAVIDSDNGFAILSGDQLVSTLAIQFRANKVIIGADVDGICTADPKIEPSAKLIPHVTFPELMRLHKIGKAAVTDVTGGMLGKITELIPAIQQGIQVIIVNATKSQNVYKALKGEEVIGTVISKGEIVARAKPD